MLPSQPYVTTVTRRNRANGRWVHLTALVVWVSTSSPTVPALFVSGEAFYSGSVLGARSDAFRSSCSPLTAISVKSSHSPNGAASQRTEQDQALVPVFHFGLIPPSKAFLKATIHERTTNYLSPP